MRRRCCKLCSFSLCAKESCDSMPVHCKNKPAVALPAAHGMLLLSLLQRDPLILVDRLLPPPFKLAPNPLITPHSDWPQNSQKVHFSQLI